MRTIVLSSVLAVAAAPAFAGGVERSNQSMAILFEQGNYLEFGASYTQPRVSGETVGPIGAPQVGTRSGNMADSFWNLDLRFRGQITDELSYAIIIDQPIGADVGYSLNTGYAAAGATGTINSRALTGVMRYEFGEGFSAYGGLRAVRTSGSVSLPFVTPPAPAPAGYTMEISPDIAYGYLVGVAYERPEIAARVSLTYNSRVRHNFDSVETLAGSTIPGSFQTSIPESLHLEFQTGIMEDTLLFGGIRWVNWSQFDITPPAYTASVDPGNALVDYPKATTTYTLGVGRRFNENWSGAISASYEPKSGGFFGNLGPTDGFASIGVAATYTIDNIRIQGGVQYRRIGNTRTLLGQPPQQLENRFSGNSAVSAGVRVGVSF